MNIPIITQEQAMIGDDGHNLITEKDNEITRINKIGNILGVAAVRFGYDGESPRVKKLKNIAKNYMKNLSDEDKNKVKNSLKYLGKRRISNDTTDKIKAVEFFDEIK